MRLFNQRHPHPEHALVPRPAADLFQHSQMTMIYYSHDFGEFSGKPLNVASHMFRKANRGVFSPYAHTNLGRRMAAGVEILERATNRYRKPAFGIESIVCADDHVYAVQERVVAAKPFCQLIHFEKHAGQTSELSSKASPLKQSKLLIVAPYSGHYATLLRDTVRALLKHNDVYITDWENARDVPLYMGNFSLEDYIQYLMDFTKAIGPNYHILGVCQPAVPVLAMTALLAAHDSKYQPLSMTLMGGPIDTRITPTKVNTLAKEKPIEWFSHSVIARVPHYYPGAFRAVCPGFLMLQGFMSLNIDAHMSSHQRLFEHLIHGDEDHADAHRRFYDEYRAVLDLPAKYFLDSVYTAFQKHLLPRGEMIWKGERVNTHAITKTALMTVEGEKDDISGVGQTHAAHTICPNIPQDKRAHLVQQGVGHYGVFNGRRWREHTAPAVSKFIWENDPLSHKSLKGPAPVFMIGENANVPLEGEKALSPPKASPVKKSASLKEPLKSSAVKSKSTKAPTTKSAPQAGKQRKGPAKVKSAANIAASAALKVKRA